MLTVRQALKGSPPRWRGKVNMVQLNGDYTGITPAWAGKSRYRCRCWSGGQDHPRMGGEKRFASASLDAYWGSPPRGRGKGAYVLDVAAAVRITPAWAGKRTRSWRAYGCPWDHPRVGGEKGEQTSTLEVKLGSPPHGRGIVVHKLNGRIIPGITPAWAGKRPLCGRGGRITPDHPRVGGEKKSQNCLRQPCQGSPPHGRGKVRGDPGGQHLRGITPA